MQNREQLVIVGNGMAGGKLVEEIVTKDPSLYNITIVGDEPYGNYNRIKLVVKLKEPSLPDFFLNTPEWYAENGVTAILGDGVRSIEREHKYIVLQSGKKVSYDKLVLTVGSNPFIPPMKGLDLPGVFALRKLDDVDNTRAYLQGKTQVSVIGGGILGLELALMLRLMGKVVTVSHLMPTLMEMQLPEDAGHYLRSHLENLGIRFVMGTYITDLLGTTAGVETTKFKDGSSTQTEAVFFSCGIRPNITLAKESNLLFNKGIVVNEHLQTSDEHIYACGECIEYRNETWGLVAPIYDQSRVLADILTGTPSAYIPSPPSTTRLKSDIPVISMGRFKPEADDEVALYVDPNSHIFKQLIVKDSIVQGAVLVGEDLNADLISLHYSAKIPVPPRRADLLFPGARSGEAFVDGKLIPDDAKICDCNGVSAAKIRKSIALGNDTLYKVMNTTKAGTGCGNCKGKIKALLISEVGELRSDPAEKYYAAGIPMDRETLSSFIKDHNYRSCSQVFGALPGSVDDSKTRMALDYLLNYIWKTDYIVEDDSRCANDRYSGNIQNDGRFSVIPNIAGGVATSRHLRAIADVADKYNAMIKITGSDRIGLFSIDKTHLKDVWKDLQMGSGHAFTKSFRACKGCVGSTHCRFGLMDSLSLGQKMGERYRGTMGPAKLKMGVSGCPRNCSEATIKDLGVVATDDGWEISIGGNGGAHVYVSQPIAKVKTDEEVLRIADRYYEFYRRFGKYGERTAYFVERIGLKAVKDAILDAPEESLLELEQSFEEARSNYRDPWTRSDRIEGESTIDDTDAEDSFVQVAFTDDIPAGSSNVFKVKNTSVAVFHGRDGKWIATHGICPHKNGPMIDSIYGNGKLVCPLHSYSFDIQTGMCDNPDIAALKIFEVIIRNEQVLVKI